MGFTVVDQILSCSIKVVMLLKNYLISAVYRFQSFLEVTFSSIVKLCQLTNVFFNHENILVPRSRAPFGQLTKRSAASGDESEKPRKHLSLESHLFYSSRCPVRTTDTRKILWEKNFNLTKNIAPFNNMRTLKFLSKH